MQAELRREFARQAAGEARQPPEEVEQAMTKAAPPPASAFRPPAASVVGSMAERKSRENGG
jgi:hypothetical protein